MADHDGFDKNDTEIIVVFSALMHDLGMSIHRADHETCSLFVAQLTLNDLPGDLYPDAQRTILRSEILHAIISHCAGAKPLTLEAGILRIADSLDMASGRSQIAF